MSIGDPRIERGGRGNGGIRSDSSPNKLRPRDGKEEGEKDGEETLCLGCSGSRAQDSKERQAGRRLPERFSHSGLRQEGWEGSRKESIRKMSQRKFAIR